MHRLIQKLRDHLYKFDILMLSSVAARLYSAEDAKKLELELKMNKVSHALQRIARGTGIVYYSDF